MCPTLLVSPRPGPETLFAKAAGYLSSTDWRIGSVLRQPTPRVLLGRVPRMAHEWHTATKSGRSREPRIPVEADNAELETGGDGWESNPPGTAMHRPTDGLKFAQVMRTGPVALWFVWRQPGPGVWPV